jgi:5-formyltetrahydrofolate cyclo-ligase
MKEILRLENLGKRNSLGRGQVEKKSLAVQGLFLGLPEFAKAKSLLVYYGVNNEVETKGIIEKALEQGKQVSLPITDFEKKRLKLGKINSLAELKKTKQGLVEPKLLKEVKKEDLDLVVLPGIAFDRQGNRIGRGLGFYDNLLRKASTRIKLVGLCFSENLEEEIPSESHDVKMDVVVTDQEVIRAK